MKYVVTYDIANDKRRTKLSDLLGRYGNRVNYSVFEIELNETKREQLLNKKYDSFRFYHLCENCVPKSFDVCNREDPFEIVEMSI